MFRDIEYLLYIVTIVLALIGIYVTWCAIDLRKYKNLSDNQAAEKISKRPKGNLFAKLVVKLVEKTSVSKKGTGRSLSKKAKRAQITALTTAASLLVSSISTGTIAVQVGSLNQQFSSVSTAIQAIFSKNEECTCYLKCTGHADDTGTESLVGDTETLSGNGIDDIVTGAQSVYELLFGTTEYERLTSSLDLTPQEKEEFDEVNQNGNGKSKNDFLKNHITDQMVSAYKKIVGTTSKFRSGDHKNRSTMTNDELEKDLENLLTDYKVNGRNPNCKACGTKSGEILNHQCLGMKQYEKGWQWEALWGEDADNSGGSGGSGNSGGNTPGNATGNYAITLDDGSYYWYHQYTCHCQYDAKDDNYGYVSGVRAGSGTVAGRGCGIYSSSIALSNILGEEITPFDFIKDVLGVTISGGNGSGSFTSTYESGIRYDSVSEVSMNKDGLAKKINDVYGSKGVQAEAISFDKDTIEKYMTDTSKVTYIIASWGKKNYTDISPFTWYKLTAGHFMVIRKYENGQYYCFTSCCSLYGGGHDGAKQAMNKGISWDVMKKYNKNGNAIAITRDKSYYNTGGSGGGDLGTGGSWYKYATDSDFPGKGSATSLKIADVTLYNGLPWDSVSGTYFFNAKQATQDFNTAIGKWAGETCLKDDLRNYASHETTNGCPTASGATEVVDGVTVAHFAVHPCTALPTFCDNFTQDLWWSNPQGCWSKNTWVSRKYCAVLRSKADNKLYYLPLHGGDSKGHTFPGGVCQTHIRGMASKSTDEFNVDIGDATPCIQVWKKSEVRDKILTTLSPIDDYSHKIIDYVGSCLEFCNDYTTAESDLNTGYSIEGYIAWPK